MKKKSQDLEQGNNRYRISELVALSGVSRDSIKYYLRAGLLPPARKPRPNLSLYTDNHLALIGLIKKFQEQTKLLLPQIAQLFNAAAYDANTLEIELLSARHGIGNNDNIVPLKTGSQDTRKLSFPDEFLRQLVDASLLEDASQTGEDEEQLAGLLWAAHSAAVPMSFFEVARKKLAELADLEVKTLIAIKRPGLSFKDTVDSVTNVDRIINRWMITEKNRQIRKQFQQVIDNSERAISTLLETVYRPSPVFRKRHRVDEILSDLSAALVTSPVLLQQHHDLSFACLAMGEYDAVISIAEAALTAAPGDAIAIAHIALAHGLQNNVEDAFEYGSLLEHSEDQHPAILQARMFCLLQRAARSGGITDTAELMKSAGELFLQVPRDPPAGQPEAVLLLAQANVAFPDFANSRAQAIEALQLLRQQLEKDAIELPAIAVEGMQASLQLVYQIYVLYYLGALHQMNGEHKLASTCFERVIQLDPASNFGKRAYLQLGQLN